MKKSLLTAILLLIVAPNSVEAEDPQPAQERARASNQLFEADFESTPTYIKSDSLTLRSAERKFLYSGNVELKNGEMTLTSEKLDGNYSESQELENLVATGDVVIIKGQAIRASGDKAVFDNKARTVVLTGSPEIKQDGSILSADLIRIFLDEDRSVAEGQVRVKLIESPPAAKKPLAAE
jgi:lipopolysaccharide transport protein LptA